jgi:hypothetical protein
MRCRRDRAVPPKAPLRWPSHCCGYSSVVERQLPKLNVARSSRVTRFQNKVFLGKILLGHAGLYLMD